VRRRHVPVSSQSDTGDCFWYSLCADALGCSLADKEANALTHPESDPDSLQPELKASAVQLVPPAELVSSEELGKHLLHHFLFEAGKDLAVSGCVLVVSDEQTNMWQAQLWDIVCVLLTETFLFSPKRSECCLSSGNRR